MSLLQHCMQHTRMCTHTHKHTHRALTHTNFLHSTWKAVQRNIKALLWNVSEVRWWADPLQQTSSFFYCWGLECWLASKKDSQIERLHFPNLQGHRRKGASREPLSCQRGKAIELENGPWLLISSQVTVLLGPLFYANCKIFKHCGNTSLSDVP